MTTPNRSTQSPKLSDLLSHYLERQSADHAVGLGFAPPAGDVQPYEAVPVQPVEPRAAWQEATTAAHFLLPGSDTRTWKTPPEWPNAVALHEPVASLAFCLGNFPQLVRELQPLAHAGNLAELRPGNTKPLPVPGLVEWAQQAAAKKQFPQTLLAIGSLRLARHFDVLDRLLATVAVPAEYQALWANERAAAAWHRGNAGEAEVLWSKAATSVPVLFNRGMAALFLDRPADAFAHLERAAAEIPESSAWHHLGRLYQTLAEARR